MTYRALIPEDNKPVPWYCALCGASGEALPTPETSKTRAKTSGLVAIEQHEQQSPGCPGGVMIGKREDKTK